MNWHSLADFLAMGGYGFYVWSSFGLTGLCLLLEACCVRRRFRATRDQLRHQIAADKDAG